MEEVWKDVPYWYGHQISNKGNVRSVDREVNHNYSDVAIKKGKLLKTTLNRRGYYEIVTYINGNKVHKTIHRLVAEAFIPNPNNYEYVNHKDENKLNNSVDNLEWCSHRYNCNYGTAIQRSALHRTNKIVRITKDKTIIYKSSKVAANQLNVYVEAIRYRVRNGFLKDTVTKEVLETWRKANQKEIDLLGDEDYIIINNLEVVN